MIKFIFTIMTIQIIAVVSLALLAGVPPDKLPLAAGVAAGVVVITSTLAIIAGEIQKRRQKKKWKP